MLRPSTRVTLSVVLVLAASALAIATAQAQTDQDKPVQHVPTQRFSSGSCHSLGYEWPGIAFPILPAEGRQQPVTAYICARYFRFVPHDWP